MIELLAALFSGEDLDDASRRVTVIRRVLLALLAAVLIVAGPAFWYWVNSR